MAAGGIWFTPETSPPKQAFEFRAPASFEEGLGWTIELLLAFNPLVILAWHRVLCMRSPVRAEFVSRGTDQRA